MDTIGNVIQTQERETEKTEFNHGWTRISTDKREISWLCLPQPCPTEDYSEGW